MATLRMERTFSAPPEKVFAFITHMDNLLQWWGPEGTTIAEHQLDFSRLGDWSAVMVSPGGEGQKVGGSVIAIDPPNFVELTLRFMMQDGDGPESTIRFDTKPTPSGGTQFLLTQTGLEEQHIADMRDKGWASALQRLENLITSN